MKSGMIATTAFELISGGVEFYSQSRDIQNAVEKEINLSESSYVQYAESDSSDLIDALERFDVMIPDEGDLQEVMNAQYEENKKIAKLLEEDKRRKPGMHNIPRNKK